MKSFWFDFTLIEGTQNRKVSLYITWVLHICTIRQLLSISDCRLPNWRSLNYKVLSRSAIFEISGSEKEKKSRTDCTIERPKDIGSKKIIRESRKTDESSRGLLRMDGGERDGREAEEDRWHKGSGEVMHLCKLTSTFSQLTVSQWSPPRWCWLKLWETDADSCCFYEAPFFFMHVCLEFISHVIRSFSPPVYVQP